MPTEPLNINSGQTRLMGPAANIPQHDRMPHVKWGREPIIHASAKRKPLATAPAYGGSSTITGTGYRDFHEIILCYRAKVYSRRRY
jgi:hypothetical protein